MACSPKILLTSVAVLLAVPVCAMADFITFENKSIDALLSAGLQTEGAFTYEALIGSEWEVQTVYGNPASSLATVFTGDEPNAGDTLVITRSGAGKFTFDSVDFATILSSNSDDVLLTGFLGGSPTDTLAITASTSSPTAFQTEASGFTSLIDLLEVELTSVGSNALLLDNFNLTIPEPAAISLLGVAALCLSARRPRLRNSALHRLGHGPV